MPGGEWSPRRAARRGSDGPRRICPAPARGAAVQMMNGWFVEWHLGMVAVGETLFTDAPRPENGVIAIPDRPGLGLTLDEDAWRETRVPLD